MTLSCLVEAYLLNQLFLQCIAFSFGFNQTKPEVQKMMTLQLFDWIIKS
jgi:hypothetical protein